MVTQRKSTFYDSVAVVCVVGLIVAAFLLGRYTAIWPRALPRIPASPSEKEAVIRSFPALSASARTPVPPAWEIRYIDHRSVQHLKNSIEQGMKADEWEHYFRYRDFLQDERLDIEFPDRQVLS